MWLDHPSFDDVLHSVWDTWHGGMAQFSLCSKLKALKAPLKALNRDEFGSIFEKAKEANAAFKEAVQAYMDDPLNVSLKLKCHELRERANFLSEDERRFIGQKSRCKFLLEGDRCTKYFHSLIKGDNVRNSISHIVKSDGSYTSSPEEVYILLVDFYRELFGSSKEVHPIDEEVVSNGYILSTADGVSLTFEGVSGLSFNPAKSSIFLAGVKEDRKRSILERVGFLEGTFPVRYLGIPLAPTSVSVKAFSPFTDAIDRFIQKWRHHSLSYAGKVELIRSVIQGVDGFWFQVFPMHDAVLRKIRSSST
ncbi:hypothetical protein LIER_16928 [Lithospermum erythrorhizon]|uniref:Uncharacterized protein n=1 Tax=Lithospermum erythrorhizon TaxID=34254 RepID=A0AAV3Q8G4_LITER